MAKVKKSKLQMEMDEHLDKIMDTFTGADGCASYISCRNLIHVMCDRAGDGDTAAVKILDVVTRFRKLIDVADKSSSMRIDL
jgi:hypothetical protein